MPVLRITRFTADPAQAEEVIARNAALVSAVRAVSPGPNEAQLIRIDEHNWAGIWVWATQADAEATSQIGPTLPETKAAFEIVTPAGIEQGEVVDAR